MFREIPDPHSLPPDDVPEVGGARFAPPPSTPPIRRWRWHVGRWLIALALLAVMAAVAWLALAAPPSRSARPIAPAAVTLLATDGEMIARRGAVVDRPVDVRDLPPYVGDSFVAIEDRRFFHHIGIDAHGIVRAAWDDLRARHVREGGSTITQQLAKLVYLDSDRTLARKAQEALIAIWLERWLTKDQILSRYLSDVYFGDNVYGLRAAAHHYFGKRPEDLTIGEAALLAGLMKAPSTLAPSENLAGAQAREALVVAAMARSGFITPAQARAARPARLSLHAVPETTPSTYFADWVLPSVRTQQGDDYRPATVRTTLDARLQRAAEAAVARAGAKGAEVALIAMKPDGRVVAMVGGRGYGQSPFNRTVQSRRQPGSAFKLFVYLAALRSGMTPDSMVEDRPVTIGTWSPANADHRYRGLITLREAFARSSNVAAVRLAQKVGPDAVVRAARDLGVASPLRADPSIALGTSGVTLLELDAAYAAVAGDRYPVTPRGLAKTPQSHGWVDALWSRRHDFSDRQHAMLLDLLSAPVNGGTARAAALDTQVFGKTGTTQDSRDAIFVGFARGLVTAVWVGRDDDRPLPGMAGGGLPARIWRGFMAEAIGAHPLHAQVPRAVDPDAGSGADIERMIGNLSLGVHIDDDGLHLSAHPRDDDGDRGGDDNSDDD